MEPEKIVFGLIFISIGVLPFFQEWLNVGETHPRPASATESVTALLFIIIGVYLLVCM